MFRHCVDYKYAQSMMFDNVAWILGWIKNNVEDELWNDNGFSLKCKNGVTVEGLYPDDITISCKNTEGGTELFHIIDAEMYNKIIEQSLGWRSKEYDLMKTMEETKVWK